MCGIAGFWQVGPLDSECAARDARRMASAIAHRGPDDEGVWNDADAGIVFAHRRLSIVDLSPEGHQPMHSRSGDRVIVFNGEIYNFEALRAELDREGAQPWRGHSDTEVLLAAIERWGVRAAVERLVGMFAFALWDRGTRTLTLARDRFGEKPLYYGWSGGTFLFASELKAIRAHPSFRASVDPAALAHYMRHACVAGPRSIYQGIARLAPGHLLELDESRLRAADTPPSRAYWSLVDVARAGQAHPFEGTAAEAAEALARVLSDAVRAQMVADVPLGAFLSGGIDSSTIVALMQAGSPRPVRTFTIGFKEGDYDEAADARAVAAHLGTEHTEWILSPEEARTVVPKLPMLYDEPFADSSQIPTHLVAMLARRHVTVSLSGDAGDELFGGYNRHRLANRLGRFSARVPGAVRRTLASALRAVPPAGWDAAARAGAMAWPALRRRKAIGDRVHKLAGLLAVEEAGGLYGQLTSFWSADVLRIAASEPSPWLAAPVPEAASLPERMMLLDALGYLPDDILVKVDRVAMGVSLETRVPFLDHRVAEFAWRLPLARKLDDRSGKKILRDVLYRHVPRALVDRPKMGFGIPLDAWLRGPLRAWAEERLDPRRLAAQGWFDATVVRRHWDEHVSGARNWQHHLWIVLMFQVWLDAWGEGLTP